MNRELLETLAYENGLEYIETVRGGNNGYPSGFEGGIIGFKDWEEVENFAREHDLPKCTFHKRDGWHNYERHGRTHEPLRISASEYGIDYNEYSSDDYEDYFDEQVKPFLADFEDFDSLQSFIDKQKEIYEELSTIDESQLVITCDGGYYETIDKEAIEWSHDTHSWVIGVSEGM